MSDSPIKAFVEFGQTSVALLERGVYALESIAASLKNGASIGGGASAAGGGLVIPFGKNKGTPLAQASDRDLQYVAQACVKTLTDPSKANWHAKEKTLLAAINEVLKSKGLAQVGVPAPKEPDMRDDVPQGGGDDTGGAPDSSDIPFAFIETRLDHP